MANGDFIIIGLPNTASNPGTTTSLTRDENRVETVFVARNLNEGAGIRGEANAAETAGVVGRGGNKANGVIGSSTGAIGVRGSAESGFPGVFGSSGGFGMSGVGGLTGVRGQGGLIGTHGIGVDLNETAETAGVVGEVQNAGNNSPGVFGQSFRGPGVVGRSEQGPNTRFSHPGVFGSSERWYGVLGESANNAGVVGQGSYAGVVGRGRYAGVIGSSSGGDAGRFWGDVRVHGILYKDGGGFRIDHPQHPEDKYLTHSFVESDDMKNVYDGVAILNDRGAASVDLPEWFEALNRDFRYQLTAVGGAAPNLHVAEEVSGNRFKIAGGEGGMKVCWQVTGIRQDPWADANRIEVEEEKADGERGYYLHPDLYDQPEEQGIGFADLPEDLRQIIQLEEGQLAELPSILDDPRLEEQRQQLEELRRQSED